MKRQGGATLVELLVALALLSAIGVISAQLVTQSTKLMGTVAKATRNPDLVIASEWIRRDLYEAVAVVAVDSGWTFDPLVLATQNGGWVSIASIEGALVRTNAPPASAADTRIILRGVVGWRWRITDGASVEISLLSFANPDAHKNLTGAAASQIEVRTERLTMALRGRPGGRAW